MGLVLVVAAFVEIEFMATKDTKYVRTKNYYHFELFISVEQLLEEMNKWLHVRLRNKLCSVML